MYRALYRKWRPQRFEDVVAQRGIVTALRNQIATGRVGHAYLFTGVRGTGFVRLEPNPPEWPHDLQKRFPGDPIDAGN